MNKPISYFLGEGLLIVFSILLALGVNEWRIRSGEAAETRRAIGSIYAELADNLSLLDDLPEYHGAVVKALREEIAVIKASNGADARTPMDVFSGIEILRPTFLITRMPQNVSWELARQRGAAARFDYELAKRLSVIYDVQDDGVVILYNEIAVAMSRPEMFSSEKQDVALSSLASLMSELASREETLVYLLKQNDEAMRAQYEWLAQEDG